MKKLLILISGRGSNMEALLAANLPAQFVAVIANRPDAVGLDTARQAGIPAQCIDHRAFANRDDFDDALKQAIDAYAPDLVILAGFMRVLGQSFVEHFRGRLINIHPSLLPAFPGLHTHRKAIAMGCKLAGATVHFVTPDLDCGPIVIQAAVPVLANDTEQNLSARVLVEEHRIYPQAIRWFCEDRLKLLADGTVQLLQPNQVSDSAMIVPPLGA